MRSSCPGAGYFCWTHQAEVKEAVTPWAEKVRQYIAGRNEAAEKRIDAANELHAKASKIADSYGEATDALEKAFADSPKE